MFNKSLLVQIDLMKIIYDLEDCIAVVTDKLGKILTVSKKAEKVFPNWVDNYLINYIVYDNRRFLELFKKLEEKTCVFNWEMFFSFAGNLSYLEITVIKLTEYYLLLANENSTKIEYIDRITTLTGEINILNQKLSGRNVKNIVSPVNTGSPKENLMIAMSAERINLTPHLSDINITKKIVYPDFEICAVTRKVTVNEKNVRLTSREFELLWLMASHPNQIFTRNNLLTTIWEADSAGDDNTVTVHIRRLRKKIEVNPNKPRYIKTVWGVGYRFELYI
ncbi:putative two component transcriptional regulator, winged helix family [Desulfofarcimen acetoxidans DSM 771]|jgi:DNA-binding winged helix-turn-helix (wHTH) protein|uniref:Putative two component transcriptional regulator, winged helix family n=1 Tax=Desulfofarcimen acetoxidans (strain ATCC 49208 / DSM 771 / KCTC 5769 / VKM B-1644 / 5575) TaxID=485916 RepID=C8W6G9_DESAS|nr:response regulator transcription factor [Desulfofarcimen acetoxidans]ACV62258.1 putative two component transcriptional regulator, winged helix family [Desulfofarcimen acetoxidans DSM 771]